MYQFINIISPFFLSESEEILAEKSVAYCLLQYNSRDIFYNSLFSVPWQEGPGEQVFSY